MFDKQPRILLVEDDYEQAMLFTQVLELSGYIVVAVDSAEAALTQLVASSFALLLADWDLPDGMQGDALIVEAKQLDPTLKAVLYSNHAHVDEAATVAGADAWFRKYEGIVPLRRIIHDLLPRSIG